MTSGSASRSACQGRVVECAPAVPSAQTPPGERDQLRSPVAHREQRINPFQARHRRAWRAARVFARPAPRGGPGCRRPAAPRVGRAEHPGDVWKPSRIPSIVPDSSATTCRRSSVAGPAVRQVGGADRADLAVGLRDDDVGGQRRQQRLVDLVQRRAGAQPLAHARVDIDAGAADVERRPADRGEALDPRGEVALVRARDQPLAQPSAHTSSVPLASSDAIRSGGPFAPFVSVIAGDRAGAARAVRRAARAGAGAARPCSLSPGNRISMFTPPIIVRP